MRLSRISGRELSWGPIKDVYAAGGLNMGSDGFFADLAGVSFDFAVPHVSSLGLSVYTQDDTLNRRTYQLSPFWSVPYRPGVVFSASTQGGGHGGPGLVKWTR